MQPEPARRLVKQTFDHPFSKEQFQLFTKNLLKYMEDAPFTYRGNTVFADFRDYIDSLERIGKYEDPDGNKLDVLIVRLKKTTSLEHARATQRRFVAKYLKGSRGDVLKDAALVAFVSPTEADWRFSYVRMEYRIETTSEGRVRVQEEFTPARRYSFLVGENENSHTAQSRLLPILEASERRPRLSDLEDAFSVEKVTREFFEQYRGLFLEIKDALDAFVKRDQSIRTDFREKGVDTGDFVKKLLGQVVFLYFLQKKGWFGVARSAPWGSGPKNFLRQLFEGRHGRYVNFFNDVLEPLFYNTLAVERAKDYSDRFECRIPFLNGGLFDPLSDYDWVDTDILLPNDLFSNRTKTSQGDVGTGVLDVFDRYNFTVKEDEPLEKDVAVDPEMLGKVFENLLEVKDRKSKGTYYTPREIVHYMCQESLTNYLHTELDGKVSKEGIDTLIKHGESVVEHESRVASEGRETNTYAFKLPAGIREHAKLIDKKLASIRICDPAVGSGAFPVGMMNEIVRARNALTPFLNGGTKRSSYEFKRQAIQNCLYGVDVDPSAVEIAKLRLWLSLVVDEEDRDTIQPLPNLDYKVVQGDSLSNVEKNLLNHHLFRQLEELKPQYFNETSRSRKQKYKQQIDELITKITNGHREFDFEVYFSEVFHEKKGFDVVIANPPYVSVEKFARTALQTKWKRTFTTYAARGDIYCFFYERGLSLLRDGGVLTFISSNKFQRAGYGKQLRKLLVSYQIQALVDFCELPVFAAATDPMIVIVEKTAPNGREFPVLVVKDESEFGSLADSVSSRAVRYRPEQLKVEGWSLEGVHGLELVEKLRANGTPLSEYVKGRLYRGIITGLNEAFVIDRATRDRLIKEDRKSAELIKPWIRGKDIKRWTHEFHDYYVIIVRYGFHAELKRYPAILKHLSGFEKKLKARGQCKTSRGGSGEGQHHWLELDNNPSEQYIAAFDQPKIVFNETSKRLHAYLDVNGNAINKTGFIILSPDASFILAVLNCSLMDWFYRSTFPSWGDPWKGGRVQFRGNLMNRAPIPKASNDEKSHLRKLAEQAAVAASEGSPTALAQIDREIDGIVYRLFNLSPEEIAMIEESRTSVVDDWGDEAGDDRDSSASADASS